MAADTVVATQGRTPLAGPPSCTLDAVAASPVAVDADSAAALKDAMQVANTTSLPLELGSLDVTQDGRVVARRGSRNLAFSFIYRGLPFAGTLAEPADAPLRLAAEFGKLPFTAELPEGRRRIRQIAVDSQRNPRVRFQITPAQDIRLLLEIRPPRPRTPVGLVAAVAAVLLEAKPHMEAMTAALASASRRSRFPT